MDLRNKKWKPRRPLRSLISASAVGDFGVDDVERKQQRTNRGRHKA